MSRGNFRAVKNNKKLTKAKKIFIRFGVSSFFSKIEMKVKELIDDLMAEKEVSEEKEEASIISYEGSNNFDFKQVSLSEL